MLFSKLRVNEKQTILRERKMKHTVKKNGRWASRISSDALCSRRNFLQATLAGTAFVTIAPAILSEPQPSAIGGKAVETVSLGKTGIKASRLAFGTGFNGYNRSSELTRRGKEQFEAVARKVLDEGITFFDMADLYGSHLFVREAIKNAKRDKLVLLSKIWPRKEKWVTPSGGAKEEIERFRTELGVEWLDICLIHCMLNDKWVEEYAKIRDELDELKARKVVRAVGVSCHHFGALKIAAQHPWVDVIFARINNRGGKDFIMDGSTEEVSAVLKQARANGKVVVGMKIFGAGKLTKPEEKDASLKYVWENQLVDAITIGFLKPEEVTDTISRMNAVLKG